MDGYRGVALGVESAWPVFLQAKPKGSLKIFAALARLVRVLAFRRTPI